MREVLIITGIVIALGATLILMVFGIRQWHMRQSVKDVPMRYEEWLSQYRTKRFYIMIAQLVGVAIGIIGLSI